MPPKTMSIGACGPAYALRYFILDQDSNYWTLADEWTKDRAKAGLFADPGEAAVKMHELMIEQVPGKLTVYWAPVTVEVKGTDEVILPVLRHWLERAVQMFLDARQGNGPSPDSMAMLRIDWDRLEGKP